MTFISISAAITSSNDIWDTRNSDCLFPSWIRQSLRRKTKPPISIVPGWLTPVSEFPCGDLWSPLCPQHQLLPQHLSLGLCPHLKLSPIHLVCDSPKASPRMLWSQVREAILVGGRKLPLGGAVQCHFLPPELWSFLIGQLPLSCPLSCPAPQIASFSAET